jgi:hypothetical protein
MEGRLTRESTLPGPRSLILTVPSSPHYLAVVRNLVPLVGTLLMLLVDAVHFLGDGKEQRKIPLLNLKAMDLPLKCDNALRGSSNSFPGAFFAIGLMTSTIFDSPMRL